MGKRQDTLEEILGSVSDILCTGDLEKPKQDDIYGSSFHEEVLAIYRELGGCLEDIPVRLGPWDLNVSGIAVEFDECLHFNRYRSITLNAPLYFRLDNFPIKDYQRYCIEREKECLKASKGRIGTWTNKSCEKLFSQASPRGDLSDGGAPRWKQRAFYDFIKDIAPITNGVRMARISIWDCVVVNGSLVQVSEILDKGVRTAAEPIFTLIQQRSGKVL